MWLDHVKQNCMYIFDTFEMFRMETFNTFTMPGQDEWWYYHDNTIWEINFKTAPGLFCLKQFKVVLKLWPFEEKV